MNKREKRTTLDAHNRASGADRTSAGERERRAATGNFSVDMASDEACYTPFTLTVSPKVAADD